MALEFGLTLGDLDLEADLDLILDETPDFLAEALRDLALAALAAASFLLAPDFLAGFFLAPAAFFLAFWFFFFDLATFLALRLSFEATFF